MATQFIVRSEQHKHPLDLKTVIYDGLEISRVNEGGIAVFEIKDPDAIIELVISRKKKPDAKARAKNKGAVAVPPAAAAAALATPGTETASGAPNQPPHIWPPQADSQTKPAAKPKKEPSPPEESKRDIYWDARYKELVDFKKEKGHCVVPKTIPKLHTWIDKQKRGYKKGNVREDRAMKLKDVGLITENNLGGIWMIRYNDLLDYKRKHGNCNVPQKWKYNVKLASWVDYQRNLYTSGKLSSERASKLNEVGFCWNAREARWNMRYSELMLFKREHGHCMVAQKYEPNPPLGEWVIVQRKLFRTGKLSVERIAKLNELGFTWDARGVTLTKNNDAAMTENEGYGGMTENEGLGVAENQGMGMAESQGLGMLENQGLGIAHSHGIGMADNHLFRSAENEGFHMAENQGFRMPMNEGFRMPENDGFGTRHAV